MFWMQVGDLMFCRPSFDTNEGVAIAPTIFVFHVFAWSVALVGCLLLTPPGHAAAIENDADVECSAKPLAPKRREKAVD